MQNKWHSLACEEVLESLHTTHEGLSNTEVQERLQKYGYNKLQERKKQSNFVRFLMQFHNLLIYVLLASALVTALLGHAMDTIVILSVVVINAIIGFIQENKAQNAMEAIKKMLAFSAVALRDGHKQKVESEFLVIGDIVFMQAGDKVLADIRLLETHGLSAQESLLTGESLGVDKHSKSVKEEALIGDRRSMVFAGTTIASGQAKGVVVATANATELGLINKMLSSVEVLTTPLVQQMDRFAKWLTLFLLFFSALIFFIGYFLQDYPFEEIFMAIVGLFVAAIPEGLPAVLTITLAIGVQSMAKRNAIVRHLPAIETIGSVSVICSDKTGTLTQNEMTVSTIVSNDGHFRVDGAGYEPIGNVYLQESLVQAKSYKSLIFLAKISLLCNDANLTQKDGMWKIEGSPTEGALVALAHKMEIDTQELKSEFVRGDSIPFDSKHKFMATLNHSHEGESMIALKGAVEVILNMCRLEYVQENESREIRSQFWHEKARELASNGQRVLALAYKKVPKEKTVLSFDDLEDSLILVALVGLIDPPRPEAIEAVKECQSADIAVKMITGDHALTAAAIGKIIGLKNCEHVLSGADIEKMSDEELRYAVLTTDIFARTTPSHKLRLVTALQANDKIVAMTGDGVNDAPALKRSNVGISMGKSATEAAKESSEFVLADDNFASIVNAVREGRRVYDNIKKVISWTLPTSASEASVIVVAILFGMAMPITPIQILWANMITAVTLGIALAFERADKNIMQRSPRAIDEPILNRVLIWHIFYVTILFLIAVFGAFHYALDKGATLEYARTLALNVLIFLEIFHLFYIRNFKIVDVKLRDLLANAIVWSAASIIFFAQIAVTYIPALQGIFLTSSLTLIDFSMIFAIGVLVFIFLEVEKQIRLRWFQNF
jgi:calcium-translocating P-type ATPase